MGSGRLLGASLPAGQEELAGQGFLLMSEFELPLGLAALLELIEELQVAACFHQAGALGGDLMLAFGDMFPHFGFFRFYMTAVNIKGGQLLGFHRAQMQNGLLLGGLPGVQACQYGPEMIEAGDQFLQLDMFEFGLGIPPGAHFFEREAKALH